MKIQKSVIIKRPVSEVFEFVCDFGRSSLWSGAVLFTQPVETETDRPGIGFCYKNLVKFLDRHLEMIYQIIEFEPNRLITAKTITGWLPSIVCYSFEALPEGVRLSYQEQVEPAAPFKPFEAMIYKNLERQLEQDLATLKDWLESGLYARL